MKIPVRSALLSLSGALLFMLAFYSAPAQLPADSIVPQQEFNIAFILPFNSDKVFIEDLREDQYYFPEETQISVEYYYGALLALDSLKKTGKLVTISVHDSKSDSATINKILSDTSLKHADMILGPLSGYALQQAASFANREKIPLVSPLLASYPGKDPNQFFILANATMKTHCQFLYDYLVQNHLTHRIVMAYRKRPQDLEIVKHFKDWRDNKVAGGAQPLRFVELTDSSKTTFWKLKDSLFTTNKNIILIPSSDEPFVRSIIKNLSTLSNDYDIKVIGMPTWVNFDLVPSLQLDTVNASVSSSFYLDKSAPAATRFRERYAAKFDVNPTVYSVRGYDQMMYFGAHLLNTGNKMFVGFPSSKTAPVGSTFRVLPEMREQEVIYRENKELFLLQHKDGTWVKQK